MATQDQKRRNALRCAAGTHRREKVKLYTGVSFWVEAARISAQNEGRWSHREGQLEEYSSKAETNFILNVKIMKLKFRKVEEIRQAVWPEIKPKFSNVKTQGLNHLASPLHELRWCQGMEKRGQLGRNWVIVVIPVGDTYIVTYSSKHFTYNNSLSLHNSPVLQMSKVKPRQVESLAQSHIADSDLNPSNLVPACV